jgi:hypothetical protein
MLCLVAGAFLLWFVQAAPEKNIVRAYGKSKRADGKEELKTRPADVQKARLPKPEELDQGESSRLLFAGESLEEDCVQLLGCMKITSQSKLIVEALGALVQQAMEELFPGVSITAYANVNVQDTHSRCSVAPEIDFVAHMSADTMFRYVYSKCTQKQRDSIQQAKDDGMLSAAKLQKSSLRATAELLSTKGFRFVGSQFRGNEIKVTLMTSGKQTLFFDLKINSPVPKFHHDLLKLCDEIHPRSLELILLVRRWAICRKLCHSSRGYHPLYHWTLMAIHFLQVRTAGPLLPPLKCPGGRGPRRGKTEAKDSGVAPSVAVASNQDSTSVRGDVTPVSELFGEFAQFYANKFDWQTEVVSIQSARRGHFPSWAPQVVNHSDGVQTATALNLADPLSYGRSLRTSSTWESVHTLRQEISRVAHLATRASSSGLLGEILEVYPGTRWYGPKGAQHDDCDE